MVGTLQHCPKLEIRFANASALPQSALLWSTLSTFANDTQTLIEALSTSPKNKDDLLRRLTAAKSALFVMQAFPSPSSVGPTVQAVFDPHIGRQLQMSTPIRVIEPPSIEDTHKALSSFLDGLEQVAHLAGCTKLATWKVSADTVEFCSVADPRVGRWPASSMVFWSNVRCSLCSVFDTGSLRLLLSFFVPDQLFLVDPL